MKGLSLERKLPLLMMAVLVVVLLSAVIVLDHEVRRSAAFVAAGQVKDEATALAELVDPTAANAAIAFRPIVRDPTVLHALTSASVSSRDIARIKALMTRLITRNAPADSGALAELRKSDGRVIARVGDTLTKDNRPSGGSIATTVDSVSLGSFYESGGRVYNWTTIPIAQNGKRIGTLAQRGRLNNQPGLEKSITGLTGRKGVFVFFRNSDGSLWATLGGRPVRPPTEPDTVSDIPTYMHSDVVPNERVVMYQARAKSTPWTMVTELPISQLTVGTRDIIRRFALLSFGLLLLGAILVWIITRRITSPLSRMTNAAEAMARGDFSHRVTESGDYEIARLGSTFNRMATEVEAANRALQDAATSAEKAQATAEEANAAKANFLAAMSHELRTPLNAIAGYVQLLEMGLRGPVTDEQQTDLSRIKRSQEYLLGLIEQVLVFTQLEASHVEFHPEDVAVDELMRDTETMVAPQIRARNIDYSYVPRDPNLVVRADRAKTQQIILNLLTNGAKYTHPGGSVQASSESRNGSVYLKVSDTGSGIPQKMLDQIFEPFVQLDRRLNQPREGVGLGLTISRDLARAMGGDLFADSIVGVGSTFTLVLPRRDAG